MPILTVSEDWLSKTLFRGEAIEIRAINRRLDGNFDLTITGPNLPITDRVGAVFRMNHDKVSPAPEITVTFIGL